MQELSEADSARKLLPCPFCGGDAVDMFVRDGRRIHCNACGGKGPAAYHGRLTDASANERAARAWNTRSGVLPYAGDPRELLVMRAAMHRRAQKAESRAHRRDQAANHWLKESEVLAALVASLAESLAEAGVRPCMGSMNPHEDALGLAVEILPKAKAAVDRIVEVQDGEDEN